MKKTSFLMIALIVINIGFLNAQTNQGRFLLELSSDIFDLGYSIRTQKSDADGSSDLLKSFNINFRPNVGYFIIDNLAIGLGLGVGLETGKTGSDSDKFTSTSLSAGPFVRYYIPISKVLPFLELSGSVGTSKLKLDYSDNTYVEDWEYKTGYMSFGGGVGLAVPLGEKVMVDVMAGYHSSTDKEKEDNEDNVRIITGKLGMNIGFVILLGSN